MKWRSKSLNKAPARLWFPIMERLPKLGRWVVVTTYDEDYFVANLCSDNPTAPVPTYCFRDRRGDEYRVDEFHAWCRKPRIPAKPERLVAGPTPPAPAPPRITT